MGEQVGRGLGERELVELGKCELLWGPSRGPPPSPAFASGLSPSPFLCGELFLPLPHLYTCLCLTHSSELDVKAHFLPEVTRTADQIGGPATDLQVLHAHLTEHPAPM